MAVFFRGMTLAERVALTEAMTLSGTTIDWGAPDLPGPVLDKHSTGGVGDNVSLMLAPMLAALGAFVPMISGRGLGHTGGTLDKLDSIPGYDTKPDLLRFRQVVRDVGCAIIGQTETLAPADRRLYAIRDVTATVESVALITASILSKKLAAGLEALVMDVKTGSGAFMPTLEASRELAESIATVATGAGLPTVSLITDMNEPLASAAGNAVEVQNAVDFLTGKHQDARLLRVTLSLGAELLRLAGLAHTVVEGEALMRGTLESGKAAETFERMVAALGGPSDFLARASALLPRAGVVVEAAPRAGRHCHGDRRARDRPRGRRTRRRPGARRRRDRSFGGPDETGGASARRSARSGRWRSCTPATRSRRRRRSGGCATPTASATPRPAAPTRSSSAFCRRDDRPVRRAGHGRRSVAGAGDGGRRSHARALESKAKIPYNSFPSADGS